MTSLRPILVLVLFFASGATSLIYEVVYSRSLALTFGITTHAVATVLCAFMGGLALGSFLVARLGHRVRNPIVLYGWLELLIGAFALVFPAIQSAITSVYVNAVRAAGDAGPPLMTLFAMAATCLLLPSTLMGATFPLFVQAMVRDPRRIGVSVGAVYAFNTLGAVAGTVLAGFWLIEKLGMSGATHVAVAGNVVVFFGAFVGRGSAEGATPAPAPPAAPATAGRAVVLVAIGASGLASLSYQILWTRSLTFFVHNSTYAFSGMLAVFLVGLALGSLLVAPLIDRITRPGLVTLFALLEAGIALSVVGSVRVTTHLKALVAEWYPWLTGRPTITSWSDSLLMSIGQSAAVLLVPTLLMGATFPVAGRLYLADPREAARRIGEVYAANTLGSIVGSFIGGFVLIPVLGGVAPAFLAMVLLNLAVAALVVFALRGGPVGKVVTGVAIAAGALWATQVLHVDVFKRVFEDRYGKIAYYKEGVTDTTFVVAKYKDAQNKPFLFYGDGRGVAGVGTFQENRMSGHLPLLLHGAPRNVLVICFGVGNTLGAMTRHRDVQHIDCVELSPHVRETSRFFTETNHDPLADPRVRLIVQDGRNHLLATDRKYDVIGLEPPEIHTAGVVNLYTKEFYELCRNALTDSGIVIQWYNMGVTPDAESRMLIQAMNVVFPHTTLWQAPSYYSWLIVGSRQPLAIDWQRLMARMAQSDIATDLAEASFAEPAELLSWLVLTEAGVDRLVAGVPVITDDKTIVDFTAPRSPVTLFGVMHYSSVWEEMFQLVKAGDDPRLPPAERRARMVADFRARTANYRISSELRESAVPLLTNLPSDPAQQQAIRADLDARIARKKEHCRATSDESMLK